MTTKSGTGFMLRAMPTMFAVLASVLVAQSASAQSTIFNIPSTDTVEKGKGYFEIDFLPQAPGPTVGSSIMIYNPRVLVGLPHDTEVGVNIPIYHVGGNPSNFAYIQPNIKTKFYKNDDAGVAAAVGVLVNIPMNETDGQLSWGLIYGNVSKKFKGDHGPRLTAGPYGVIAKTDDPVKVGWTPTAARGGVLLGYEQPLSKTVSFVADWFSGKNNIGYFTPGLSITLPHSGLFNIGYSFGNDSFENSNATKNRYVFVYYGITF